MRGYFISFEGGEGSGKSTQIEALGKWLETLAGAPTLRITREPGGTGSAEAIRDLLVKGAADKWRPATEALLMSASRHEHVEQVLRPALAAGNVVLSDRYNDSTRVYQGIVGGVPGSDIEALNHIACGDLEPDLTLLLDMDVETGLNRAGGRDSDESRFESKGLEFHQKVREAFLSLAGQYPSRFVVIDASRSQDAITADIRQTVLARLTAAGLLDGVDVDG